MCAVSIGPCPACCEMRFARDVSESVAFMDKGLVAEQGPPAGIVGAPRSPRLVEGLRGTRDH